LQAERHKPVADMAVVDTVPVDTEPAEAVPVDTEPAEAVLADTEPAEAVLVDPVATPVFAACRIYCKKSYPEQVDYHILYKTLFSSLEK